MEPYIYLIYAGGLLLNGYIFWVFLQLALASWGSNKASEKWVAAANSPIMQLLAIRWVSVVLTVAMAVQIASLILLTIISVYTGEPIDLNRR
jgi:hypothetical protein